MQKGFKFSLAILLFFLFSPTFADVFHGNGYNYILAGKSVKFDSDKEIIKKFTKAYGSKLDIYTDRKKTPKLSKLDGKPIAYLLKDPGKPRGDKPARRKTTLMVFNQEIPQALKDLAISDFAATAEEFKEFPVGFRFQISERRSGKFSSRVYAYSKGKKRGDTPEMIDMTDGTMLTMPKGVYAHKSKSIPKAKGTSYTLWGRGTVETMAEEIVKNLKDAAYEADLKRNTKKSNINEITIKFKKGEVDGFLGLVQTTTKDPSVNLSMLVKSSKCQNSLGNASIYAPAMMPWTCK